MNECWSEGELRAYHDGELLPADAGRVVAHLAECAHCKTLAEEVAARATRVAALLGSLPEPGALLSMPRLPQPARIWPRRAAVAAGLAAALVVAVVLASRWAERPPPAKMAAQPPPMTAAALQAATPSPKVLPAAPNRQRTKRLQAREAFLALDDEPLETGLIMRVALGESGIPVDVVLDKDGRPRAIRLVKN
jgi:anti-sigma factor RsiW